MTTAQKVRGMDAAIKEAFLRFVEPNQRGAFLVAFDRVVHRRDVTVPMLAGCTRPYLRRGLAGEFDNFIHRLTRK